MKTLRLRAQAETERKAVGTMLDHRTDLTINPLIESEQMAQAIVTPECGTAPSSVRSSAKVFTTDAKSESQNSVRFTGLSGWGRCYKGAIEDFIYAEFFERDQCPGKTGIRKIQATYYNGVRQKNGWNMVVTDPGFLHIKLTGKRDALVTIGHTPETYAQHEREHHARMADWRKQREAEEQAQKLAREAKKSLDAMPTTHTAYRTENSRLAKSFHRVLVAELGKSEYHGFKYDDEEIAEIRELQAEILKILETGETRFNAKLHASIRTRHHAHIARADKKFVGVIDTMLQLGADGGQS